MRWSGQPAFMASCPWAKPTHNSVIQETVRDHDLWCSDGAIVIFILRVNESTGFLKTLFIVYNSFCIFY